MQSIPEWLGMVEEIISEEISSEKAETLSEAIKEVADDLDKIKVPFIVFILNQNIKTLKNQIKKYPELAEEIQPVIKVNKKMIKAQEKGVGIEKAKLEAELAAELLLAAKLPARSAAWPAAARIAAWSAAWSANSASIAFEWTAGLAGNSMYELGADELLRLLRRDHEKWLYGNKSALKQVLTGLEQAKLGKVVKR